MFGASHRRGLTRSDAVVVLGLCAISIGLLLPAIQKARAGAGCKTCQNNLMQIALATLEYHDTYGQFAPGMDDQYVGPLIQLLPFVGRDDLYKNFSFDPKFSLYFRNPYNLPPSTGTDDIPRPPDLYGCEGEVDVFLCPDGPQPDDTVNALLAVRYGTAGRDYRAGDGLSDSHLFAGSPGQLVLARSHYLAMAGYYWTPSLNGRYRGVFTYNSATQLSDLERGPENTIIYGEYWGGYIAWSGGGGIPSGWSNGSRSVGFNYSTFGTCPSTAASCDFQQSMGLSWATFGALHGKKFNIFNVAMADGSVQSLAGDIDYIVWLTLCSVRNPGGSPGSLRADEPWAGID
jgi:prepilin-type processing-associated H-X9-DG protein